MNEDYETILNVDDSEPIRYAKSRTLRRAGFRVLEAATGQEALRLAAEERPALVVLDVNLPDISGLEVCRRIKQMHHSMLVLQSSASFVDAEDRVRGLEGGADSYLTEPVTPAELVAAVRALLRLGRAERAVQESERRFRALAEASSDVIYRMNPDWSEMLHLAGGEFIANTEGPSDRWLETYIFPEDQPHVVAAVNAAIRDHGIFELEHRVRRVDGSAGWTFSRAVPLLDGRGNITEWFGTASDVTERKRIETLRAAQNKILELTINNTALRQTLDELVRTVEAQASLGMLGSIMLLDEDGLHLRHGAAPNLPEAYNDAIDGMAIGPNAGSCGAAAYRHAPVYVCDIALDPLWADFRDLALSHGLRACWSTPICSGDGRVLGTFAMYNQEPREPTSADLELIEFVVRSASLVIEHRRTQGALIGLNQTLEQRVSEALAERKLWADIVESTDAMICVLSPEFKLLAVNKAYGEEFARIYGLRPQVGGDLLALLASRPAEQAAAKAVWERALNGEEFTTIEEFGDESKARPTYEITYNVLRDSDGRTIGAFQYAWDVTERLRTQAQLAEAEARLGQAQRMEALGQLAGGIAHDFNNVLQAVSGGLSLIQRRADDTEVVRQLARMAGDAAGRGATITARLLAFARKGELRATPVPVPPLLENLREILSSTLGAHITVRIDASKDAPALLADKAQLETVLVNLAVNARDAMPSGGTLIVSAHPERVISVDAHYVARVAGLSAGAYVRLELTDTGTGMDAATLARASEPFFTTKPVGQGTGLGLAMARGFAQQSGGAFAIRSVVAQGTTVTLWFPQAASSAVGEDPAQVEMPMQLSGHSALVLVVDDDAMVCGVVAQQLNELGYQTIQASDGLAALARLDGDEKIDLLVTDFSMPGMNGLMLVQEAQRRRPGFPALLLTGYAETGLRLDVGERMALLRKPVSGEELAECTAALLKPEPVG